MTSIIANSSDKITVSVDDDGFVLLSIHDEDESIAVALLTPRETFYVEQLLADARTGRA